MKRECNQNYRKVNSRKCRIVYLGLTKSHIEETQKRLWLAGRAHMAEAILW